MKQILPGSFEHDDETVTAGVHAGPSEWEIKDLRYVRGNKSEAVEGDTVVDFLTRIYDSSTGCLVNGDFKRTDQTT